MYQSINEATMRILHQRGLLMAKAAHNLDLGMLAIQTSDQCVRQCISLVEAELQGQVCEIGAINSFN